jgi:carbon-monoxide dehydrogenase medium subunit
MLVIGAATPHADVAASSVVRECIPALAALAGEIGDPAVRHKGTLGGSVANNDPAADYPAAVLALDASIKTTGRTIAADDFFTGMFETALQPGELLTEIAFAMPERAGYAKFPNPASRYAMVGVFVAEFAGSVRVAVTGAAPCVFRIAEMEAALAKAFTPEAIAHIAVPSDGLNSDLFGSAKYRAHLIGIMARRAVAAAIN